MTELQFKINDLTTFMQTEAFASLDNLTKTWAAKEDERRQFKLLHKRALVELFMNVSK